MAKKTLGYGFLLAGESFIKALGAYYDGGSFVKSKKEVLKEIKEAKARGDISRWAKPKVFKVTVETQE